MSLSKNAKGRIVAKPRVRFNDYIGKPKPPRPTVNAPARTIAAPPAGGSEETDRGSKLKQQNAQGALYVNRLVADQTVKMLARSGIVSAVVEEGRWFRVEVYR